jgi:hypothetical protein
VTYVKWGRLGGGKRPGELREGRPGFMNPAVRMDLPFGVTQDRIDAAAALVDEYTCNDAFSAEASLDWVHRAQSRSVW